MEKPQFCTSQETPKDFLFEYLLLETDLRCLEVIEANR